MSVVVHPITFLFAWTKAFRFGPMRLSGYGACAVTGVLVAMGVSGRAARRSGLNSETAWDAGFFAVVCGFVTSRLFLVASDPKAFVRYPLLVLGMPSLTFWGMVVAAVCVWMYLRWKRLPVLWMLDVFAPGGAVLGAFLEFGHWLDGSQPGMPVFRGASGQADHLIPVAMYGTVLSLLLAAGLWTGLERQQWGPRSGGDSSASGGVPSVHTGRVAAWGMLLGGSMAFGLDMLSLPDDLFSALPMEAGQMVALGVMLAGALLWTLAPHVHEIASGQRGTKEPGAREVSEGEAGFTRPEEVH